MSQSSSMASLKASNIKSLFHAWCLLQKLTPKFNVQEEGLKAKFFVSEVHVSSHPYIGIGRGTSKKAAKIAASRDFVDNYLTKNGMVDPKCVPPVTQHEKRKLFHTDEPSNDEQVKRDEQSVNTNEGIKMEHEISANFFTERTSEPANHIGQAANTDEMPGEEIEKESSWSSYKEARGNWTLVNSKIRLNQFLKDNYIKTDYAYSWDARTKEFSCGMKFYVESLKTTVSAEEWAPSKLLASQRCALSLVRQLYRAGLIGMARCPKNVDPKLGTDGTKLLHELSSLGERTRKQATAYLHDSGPPKKLFKYEGFLEGGSPMCYLEIKI